MQNFRNSNLSQRFTDVEVRVGDEKWTEKGERITVNTVCTLFNETLEYGVERTRIECEEPIRGRFLTMQMIKREKAYLEVNEIVFYGAFAQSKFAWEACGGQCGERGFGWPPLKLS